MHFLRSSITKKNIPEFKTKLKAKNIVLINRDYIIHLEIIYLQIWNSLLRNVKISEPVERFPRKN